MAGHVLLLTHTSRVCGALGSANSAPAAVGKRLVHKPCARVVLPAAGRPQSTRRHRLALCSVSADIKEGAERMRDPDVNRCLHCLMSPYITLYPSKLMPLYTARWVFVLRCTTVVSLLRGGEAWDNPIFQDLWYFTCRYTLTEVISAERTGYGR